MSKDLLNDEETLKKYLEDIEARASLGQQDSPGMVVGAEDDTVQAQNRFDAKMAENANQVKASAGNSDLQNAGAVTTGAGAVSGNVALGGAGLAIQTVGMIDSAKRKEEQAKIDAYNNKLMAQRQAVRNMFA